MKKFKKIALTTFMITSLSTIAADVKLSGLADVSFGSFSPGVNVISSSFAVRYVEMCAYTDGQNFDISLSSAGTSLISMTGSYYSEELPYEISLSNVSESGGSYSDNLISSKILSGTTYGPFFYHSSYTGNNCVDNVSGLVENNIKLQFSLSGRDILNTNPDNYVDILTIVIRGIDEVMPLE